jgi:hypothetical protein
MSDPYSEIDAAALARCVAELEGQSLPEIAAWRHLSIDSGQPPWLDSGIALSAGQQLSWFSCGATQLKALTQISVPARFQLWARVGAGDVLRGTRDSHSFQTEVSGALELGSYFPGEWTNPHGDNAVPDAAYGLVEGTIEVLLVAWQAGIDASEGLAALARIDDSSLASRELARLAATPLLPAGWDYLWFLGPSESFRSEQHGGAHCIACATRADAAILHHDAVLPFLPDTRLEWRWCVDALPSALPEDSLPTHDYLSIAMEFDNGLDLTYMWSAGLAVGTVFRCPLPNWDQRETHAVVRSGTQQLGRWLAEERDVYADYQSMIAPTATASAPGRVLRVWLIAVSLFQRGEGACRFESIALVNAAGKVLIE